MYTAGFSNLICCFKSSLCNGFFTVIDIDVSVSTLGAYSPPLRTADYRAKEWMVAEIGEGLGKKEK